MRWPQWHLTRADIAGILFAFLIVLLSAIALVRFPDFHQATGFGPDWDCKVMPKGDPICTKKPGR